MAGLYMRDRGFAREVSDLEPPWASTRWSLVRILRRLDEAGVVHPVLRFRLPEDFARFDFRYPHIPEEDFAAGQVEELTAVEEALGSIEARRPEALREQLENEGSPLAPYLVESSTEAAIRWDDWMVAVDETENGRVVERPYVVSVYGSWQKIQCWFAIEARSFHALIDPTQMTPEEVFRGDWNLSLGDQLLKCTVGNGRALKAFKETNEQAWLRKLYTFREEMRHAERRLQRPEYTDWQEGKNLSYKDRKTRIDNELTERAEELGVRWVDDRRAFCERISLMLELVGHAEDLHSPELADVLHDDLWAAIDWSFYLYSKGFWELNDIVEPPNLYQHKTLSSELRPTWHESRRSAQRFLQQLVDSDALHPELSLAEESLPAFFDFLVEHGLESWMLELSQVNEEFAHPTDASLDRRFLHLRSLALLTESVIKGLADVFGTEADRETVRERSTRSTYRAFLRGPGRPPEGESLWQCLCAEWDRTHASDTQEFLDNLELLLDGDTPLCPTTPDLDPVGRAILTTVAFRHYGAHHFTRDRTLLVRNLGRLMGSVAQTTIFYWNQATSDA